MSEPDDLPGEFPRELRDDGPEDLALDDALVGLTRWIAEAQVDEAAAERRRAASLRRQADDEATLDALLVDLAERGHPVVVQTRAGRRHQGRIALVGVDLLELDPGRGGRVVVATSSVMAVRVAADPGSIGAEASPAPDRPRSTLGSRLSRLAETRTPVTVVALSGEACGGELAAVGRDVLTLRLEGGGVAYVPLASVAEVSLPESG